MKIIDFHAHAIPNAPFEGLIPNPIRTMARFWSRPMSRAFHDVQPWLRFLPPLGRVTLEEAAGLMTTPFLLVESSIRDLEISMDRNGVEKSLLIASPPKIPNDWLLSLLEEEKWAKRIIVAVNFPANIKTNIREELKKLRERGVQFLKIHPAMDGAKPDHESYETQLQAASELGMSVILHTGCLHSHLFYKEPKSGSALLYESWYKRFPNITFFLAHMNMDAPAVAMDLAEQYSNLMLETSWQPAETIAEAVRRVGSDRIFLGSDWPFLGNNQKISIRRVKEAMGSQMISDEDGKKILGLNAENFLKARGMI